MSTALSLTFLTVLFIALGSVLCSQTGIKQITDPNGEACSDVLTYLCTTTGLGEAVLNISGIVFNFRHGAYRNSATGPNQELNNTKLDGQLMAGNLLESDDKTCFDRVLNQNDFCYTATLIAHVTNETVCRRITCSVFNGSDTTLFGDALIENVPPPPSDIAIVNQSTESVTAEWTPGIADCPGAMFQVNTTNCGNCRPTITTTINRIVCDGLALDQVCVLAVRSVSKCGSYSVPMMLTVNPPEVTPPVNVETARNVAIGAPLGVLGGVMFIFIITSVTIFFLVRRYKNNRSSQQEIASERLNDTGLEHAQAESSLDNTSHQECPKKPEPEEGSTIETGAVQATQLSSEEHGVKETDKLILSSPASESQPASALYRGMEQMEMPLQFQYFSGQTSIEDKPNPNEPRIEEVVEKTKKDEADDGPRSKPPIVQDCTLSEGGKLLTQDTEPDGEEEVEPDGEEEVKPKGAEGPSQPSSSSSEESDNDSTKGLVPEEAEGPFLHVGTNRNYTRGATDDPIPGIMERLGNLESNTNERITKLETNCKDHETNIKTLNRKILKLEKELRGMKSKCANLEKLNADERKRHKEREKELEDQIQELQKGVTEERVQKEQLIKELAEARAQLKQQNSKKIDSLRSVSY